MNKKKKIIILIMIIIIIGISGYFLYSRLLNKNIIPIKDNDDTAKDEYKEYSLERYAYTNLNISKNSKMNFAKDLVFITSDDKKYLEIYDEQGQNITDEAIKNIEINNLQEVKSNNNFLGYTFQKDNHGYFINNQGKIILDVETSSISSTQNYLLVDSNKLCYTTNFNGYEYKYYCQKIYDTEGNLIIDGTDKNYSQAGLLYSDSNISYFAIRINDKVGIVDNKNNMIIDFKYSLIEYDETKNVFYAKEITYKLDKNQQQINKVDIYSKEGNLLKEIPIDTNNNSDDKYEGGAILSNNIQSFYINNNMYIIDEKLELKSFDNVYWNTTMGMNGYYKNYFITDNIYIKSDNGNYTVHDLEGKQIIDIKFKYVGNTNPDNINSIGIPNSYITLCKNEDRTKCGAIDLSGKILIDFENELHDYAEECDANQFYCSSTYYGFKNKNEYFDILEGKMTKKITCDNFNYKISKYLTNTVIVTENNSSLKKIIDYNCNYLSTTKYYNIYEYENYIIAQKDDWKTYDVYNTFGNIIEYANHEEGKLNNFLGYNDNKLYFYYQGYIYTLQSK